MKDLGRYLLLMYSLFIRREKFKVYVRLVVDECITVGINSVFIVTLVSLFIGAVTAVQTAHNLVSDFIPVTVIGMITRDMTVLELSPTILSVVLAGKVGSNIAGHLGTMRITEQIDALEVMGINSSSYLILPKIIACMITFPLLVIISGFLSIYGGFLAATLTNELTPEEYIIGIRMDFIEFNIWFALIKSLVFAFLIASISSYKGFYTRGGALEVGQSSTGAVTSSCVAILSADYLLAQLIL
ncbi:MAG: ABC transporter permease [Cytophagaceae bacterium]|nr:ABC transporter permease [Cytophagaceae bacterium]MDW8456487.1 ABC transporter permease [Cytophagaceae bacterium]